MATKAELIEICKAGNIFHRASWNKKQLEDAIASGVKFGDPVDCVCPRSGLVFQVPIEEKREGAIHPDVAWYTQHSNWEIRYPAVRVIESRKWDSWEDLHAAIKITLNPPSEPDPDWNFKGAWSARIEGYNPKYRFEREFLKPVKEEGRFKFFDLQAAGDGYYESCYKSGSGNESRCYNKVEGGKLFDSSLEEIEALFPVPEAPAPVSVEGCTKVEKYVGAAGQTVRFNDALYTVVRVDAVDHWEDEDGVAGTDEYHGDCYLIYEETKYTTWLRPASEDEITVFLAAETVAKTKAQAKAELKAIDFSGGHEPPKGTDYPKGLEYVQRMGYSQPNEILVLQEDKLWSLRYNGRDGDDWSYNNVSNTWIGFYLEISPDRYQTFKELIQCATQ